MRYNPQWAAALVDAGHRLGSAYWSKAQRMDFIATYKMGGEL